MLVEALKVLIRKKISTLIFLDFFSILKVFTNTDKKSSQVLLGEMAFSGHHRALGSQTGVKKGSNIKNAPIKLKPLGRVFWSGKFDEIDNIWSNSKFSSFTGNFCHFRAQKLGQNCDYFQRNGNFAHKGFLRLSIPWKW